jgi:hypothetical protein
MSKCVICYCQIDSDDHYISGGMCGNCIDKIKNHIEKGWKTKNVCKECGSVIPSDWSHCICGGRGKD